MPVGEQGAAELRSCAHHSETEATECLTDTTPCVSTCLLLSPHHFPQTHVGLLIPHQPNTLHHRTQSQRAFGVGHGADLLCLKPGRREGWSGVASRP
jgi:hypothetical protein